MMRSGSSRKFKSDTCTCAMQMLLLKGQSNRDHNVFTSVFKQQQFQSPIKDINAVSYSSHFRCFNFNDIFVMKTGGSVFILILAQTLVSSPFTVLGCHKEMGYHLQSYIYLQSTVDNCFSCPPPPTSPPKGCNQRTGMKFSLFSDELP